MYIAARHVVSEDVDHVVSEDVDELRLVLRLGQVAKDASRKSGERLVGRGKDGERPLPGRVSTRSAALSAVTSVERSGVATARSTKFCVLVMSVQPRSAEG